MAENENSKFAIVAEVDEHDKPLYSHNLSFEKLVDEVIVPYRSEKNFFIDGVSCSIKTLKRIKIIQQNPRFDEEFRKLHQFLKLTKSSGARVSVEDYPVRLDAIFRETGDDVTSQVISAYQEKISDKLKDYVPNKKDLINAAFQFFSQNFKL